MLILTRKQGQAFLVGSDIEVTVSEISGDKVRIAIDAPHDVKILRKELADAQSVNKEASQSPQLEPSALKNLFQQQSK